MATPFVIDTAQLVLPAVNMRDESSYFQQITKAVPASLLGLIRRKLGDYPEMNRLIQKVDGDRTRTGEEFSSEDYLMGVTNALSSINSEEPASIQFQPRTDLNMVPMDIFLGYSVCEMLEMAVLRRTKNELVYSAQGVSVDTQKGERYRVLCETQRAYYRDKCRRYKKYIDIQMAWGGLSSSYGFNYVMLL